MATVNLGAIKFNWKGAYNNATAYVADDVVSSGGNSYVCILASTGNAVSNGTYWSLMAQAGTNGTNGTDVGLGTAGQVLQTNSGASATEWATPAGGAFSLISSATASNSANITLTIDTTQYNTFFIRIENMVSASSGQSTRFTFADAGGFATTAYAWVQAKHNSSTHAYGYNGGAGLSAAIVDQYQSSIAKESFSANLWLNAPSASQAAQPYFSFEATLINASGVMETMHGACGLPSGSAFTMTQLKIYMSSGLITSGRFSLYGLSQS